MATKKESKVKPQVMEDDLSSNESFEVQDDEYFFSDNSDSISDSEDETLNKNTDVKPVANIMNKILATNDEGAVILSKFKREVDEDADKEAVAKKAKFEKKKKWLQIGRLRPHERDYEKEKRLRIIGTQGVVQLFSTLQKYRGELSDELSDQKTCFQRQKVHSKKGLDSFMSLLEKEGRNIKIKDTDATKQEKTELDVPFKSKDSNSNSAWNVLADNYYNEPEAKGWDQEDSDDG